MCNKVFYVYFGFAVYCFYFNGNLDSFHFGVVKLVGNHQKLLNLLLGVEKFVFVRINDFEYFKEEI